MGEIPSRALGAPLPGLAAGTPPNVADAPGGRKMWCVALPCFLPPAGEVRRQPGWGRSLRAGSLPPPRPGGRDSPNVADAPGERKMWCVALPCFLPPAGEVRRQPGWGRALRARSVPPSPAWRPGLPPTSLTLLEGETVWATTSPTGPRRRSRRRSTTRRRAWGSRVRHPSPADPDLGVPPRTREHREVRRRSPWHRRS
jgi:hypothetical protein